MEALWFVGGEVYVIAGGRIDTSFCDTVTHNLLKMFVVRTVNAVFREVFTPSCDRE